jgi:glycosyltransferase involved in cell wall biosynthesis
VSIGARTVVTVRPVHVVLPGNVDDPASPSGGNLYDRRVCSGLAEGRPVHEIAVAGSWPLPSRASRDALARELATVPDGGVVLLDGLVACGVPDVIVPEAARLRLVVLVHLPLGEERGAAPELDAREREALHAAAAVVATSTWTARRLVEHHGLPAERVHVVVPGADPAPLAPGSDGATGLLCVGSLTATKGQDLLVEALAEAADLGWSCTVVGPLLRDPAYVTSVRAAITAHGLDERIELTGPRTGDELAAAFAAADLLVLPSRAESFGMVAAEALARGIPVLATALDGIAEALGRTLSGAVPGLLVPHEHLAEGLRRWLSDGDLRGGLRAAARERRPTITTWDSTVRLLEGVL